MTSGSDALCPFCGLGCGDLDIARDTEGLHPRSTGCPDADRLFRRAATVDGGARLGGDPASLDEAIATAARRLSSARTPLVTGLAADTGAVLAALTLAERVGGVVDHDHSEALFRNLSVFRRLGWSTTTLAELRNRCDLVLVIGRDPASAFPRLWERWFAPPPAYQPDGGQSDGAARRAIFLGDGPLPETERCLPGRTETVRAPNLIDAVRDLRAAVAGRGGDAMMELAARLRAARYAVVIWAAGLFTEPEPDLLVEALVRLIRDLDQKTRCAGLPLSGADNLLGANQACAWRTGFPLRTGFMDGVPTHDPDRLDGRRLARDADAVLWISAFRPETAVPETCGALIALAPPETVFTTAPAVFIPVGTPGIDHAGDVFRADSVVALRAGPLIDRGLPSAEMVLRRIIDALPAGGTPC